MVLIFYIKRFWLIYRFITASFWPHFDLVSVSRSLGRKALKHVAYLCRRNASGISKAVNSLQLNFQLCGFFKVAFEILTMSITRMDYNAVSTGLIKKTSSYLEVFLCLRGEKNS